MWFSCSNAFGWKRNHVWNDLLKLPYVLTGMTYVWIYDYRMRWILPYDVDVTVRRKSRTGAFVRT